MRTLTVSKNCRVVQRTTDSAIANNAFKRAIQACVKGDRVRIDIEDDAPMDHPAAVHAGGKSLLTVRRYER